MIPAAWKPRARWTGALLLSLSLSAGAAEPTARASAPTATEPRVSEPAAQTPALAFDFRGANVREVVRATAASQASHDYRVEPPRRETPDLAAALKQDRSTPAPKPRAPAPRLPDPQPSCADFISCAVMAVLGLDDDAYEDDQFYQRVNRDRLMNQGVFTSWGKSEAIRLPMTSAEAAAAGAPLMTLPPR